MAKNVYIHIPFCKQKCKYCSFVSFELLKEKEAYLKALKQEISNSYRGEELSTLYLGGGTPSLLTDSEVSDLLGLFNVTKNTEITMELNPESVDYNYLKELYNLGINRLSFGCQTFDDKILKIIGRLHNSAQVKDSVISAQKIGFKNINLDFIYGLPNQSTEDFANDLKTAIGLGVQHISLYGLKIDEGCYFYNHKPENLPDDDIQADMYLKACKILKDFEHYEISNFGIPSKHNLNYWNNKNYYGFGVSAHGYIDNIRYSNTNSLSDYIQNPLKHNTELQLTKQQQLEEEIFLGFRKMTGINIFDINKKFEIDFGKKYQSILEKYKKYFIKTPNGYALNTDGILISNCILSEFLE